MTDNQDLRGTNQTVDFEATYRRRRRSQSISSNDEIGEGDQDIVSVSRRKSFRMAPSHHLLVLLLSIALTGTTVVLPFLSDLATDTQSFHLYTGQMMLNGQLPYSDIFTTGGFLYYVLIGASSVLGSPLWLLGVQWLAYYVSGIYLYKLLDFYTDDQSVGMAGSFMFYLLNLGLGFGGLYPVQWAMPFVLLGMWFIVRYFAGIVSDEGFIAYGFYVAMATLLEPRTLIFWGLAFLLLSGYNLSRGFFARGFYQNLAMILGIIVVVYTAGYFIFNMELLLPYLSQAGKEALTQWALGTEGFWKSALFQLAIAFFSGILLGLVVFVEHIRKAEADRLSRFLLAVSALSYALLSLGARSWSVHQLLLALPFGLILTMVSLDGFKKQRAQRRHSHRRQEDETGPLTTFLFSHLYGPLVVALLGAVLPVYRNFQQRDVMAERRLVANYIKDNTEATDEIIVIDHQATIYQESLRRSATRYPISSLYLSSAKNRSDFEDEFLENKARVIVLSKSETLSQAQARNLEKYYSKESLENLEHFQIYRLN